MSQKEKKEKESRPSAGPSAQLEIQSFVFPLFFLFFFKKTAVASVGRSVVVTNYYKIFVFRSASFSSPPPSIALDLHFGLEKRF